MEKDKDYPVDGILPQYAHLRGMHQNLPVIRKLLGLPEHGDIDTTTVFGRALQKFVENDSKGVLCEGGANNNATIELAG